MWTVTSRCKRSSNLGLMVIAAVLPVFSLPVFAAEAPISAAVAGLYVGRLQIVEGKVEAAERRDSTVRLQLGTNPQSLAVSLVIGLLSRFPPHPEQHYLGKTIRVSGTIESFRGVPEITVRDADHIQLVDAGGVSAPATAPAANSEAERLRQQVDQLRTQLHELESRLQQLERAPAQP